MNNPYPHTPTKRGFSLIEAAIVLGVVGLVIGGIWVAAASVQENRRQSRYLSQILEIVQNVRRQYKGFVVPETFLAGLPKESWPAFFPGDMITSSTYPQSPWGTNVHVVLNCDSCPQYIGVSVSLPNASCIALAPRIAASARGELFDDPAYPDWLPVTNADGEDISTPEAANAGCSGAIELRFKH